MNGPLGNRISKLEKANGSALLPRVDEIWLYGLDDSTKVLLWTNPNKEKSHDQLAAQ